MRDIDTKLDRLIEIAEKLVARLDRGTPGTDVPPGWNAAAFRWRKSAGLIKIEHPRGMRMDDLLNIDDQKAQLDRNTRQFIQGLPSNNALLWGSRGTGKSSLVRALLSEYADQGLRLIEVDRTDLVDLPEITDAVYARPERFILFTDDLSFEANDPSYKALKAMLDGSIAGTPDNVLIYATSNRRHLMPEFMHENLEAKNLGGEIHHGETVEEKISLSERFGLWLSFHPFTQDHYLAVVGHWLSHYLAQQAAAQPPQEAVWREEALRFALLRGSRSGRVASQFARDWVGRRQLK